MNISLGYLYRVAKKLRVFTNMINIHSFFSYRFSVLMFDEIIFVVSPVKCCEYVNFQNFQKMSGHFAHFLWTSCCSENIEPPQIDLLLTL